jgi:poly(3-hydroxybutyrate) depolymerase
MASPIGYSSVMSAAVFTVVVIVWIAHRWPNMSHYKSHIVVSTTPQLDGTVEACEFWYPINMVS